MRGQEERFRKIGRGQEVTFSTSRREGEQKRGGLLPQYESVKTKGEAKQANKGQ